MNTDVCIVHTAALLQVVDMAVQASETSVMITDSSETVVWANCALAKLAGVNTP
jgi:hypothetical protein